MSSRLASIEGLTRMILEAELARLKALSDALASGQAAVDELSARGRDRQAALSGGPGDDDLAFALGRDGLWQAWLIGERARLNSEVAQAAARREAQRRVASRAFGRVEAVAELERRAAEQRRLAAARRVANGD